MTSYQQPGWTPPERRTAKGRLGWAAAAAAALMAAALWLGREPDSGRGVGTGGGSYGAGDYDERRRG